MPRKRKVAVSFLVALLLALLSAQAIHGAALESGMRGDAVLQLQKDLKKLGFFKENPTGYFGEITEAAVIGLQKKYGLTQDGIAGSKTLAQVDKLMGRKTTTSRANTVRLSVVDYSKNFLGVRYVWGGTTPKGFDCSGFVKYVFKKFGVTLNRVSASQAKQGTAVKKANLLPGDLVFFDTNGGRNRINHVGIYIGNGKFIQSSSDYSGVVVSSLTSGFYAKTYMTARRVLK